MRSGTSQGRHSVFRPHAAARLDLRAPVTLAWEVPEILASWVEASAGKRTQTPRVCQYNRRHTKIARKGSGRRPGEIARQRQ